jgi:hypothetical protein
MEYGNTDPEAIVVDNGADPPPGSLAALFADIPDRLYVLGDAHTRMPARYCKILQGRNPKPFTGADHSGRPRAVVVIDPSGGRGPGARYS